MTTKTVSEIQEFRAACLDAGVLTPVSAAYLDRLESEAAVAVWPSTDVYTRDPLWTHDCPACHDTDTGYELAAIAGIRYDHAPYEQCVLECLDRHNGGCQGTVELRYPLSGTGRSFPRCDKHWDERLKIQEGIDARYPDHAPSDFDPAYAGESWDEDY